MSNPFGPPPLGPGAPGPGDVWQYDLGADRGMVKFHPSGKAHHTVIGGLDENGEGVRISWDANRHGGVSPGSVHAGEYPPRRDP